MEVYLIMAVVCAVIGLMIDNGRGISYHGCSLCSYRTYD